MVIDFHTHVFPDAIAEKTINALARKSGNTPYTDGTDVGLLNSMEKAGVNISVALPVLTKPSQFDSITNFAFEINKKYSDKATKIISFAGIHPDCDNIEQKIKYIKQQGFLGIKIHPDYQNTFLNDEKYIKIIDCAKDYDLIVVTHSGHDDGFPNVPVKCTPEIILEVCKKVKYNKMVFAHYGAHRFWDDALAKLCDLDVYFDTAFTMHQIYGELFLKILNKHGADKILFATDCPWGSMENDLSKIRSLNINRDDLDKILYTNAVKLLNLKEN